MDGAPGFGGGSKTHVPQVRGHGAPEFGAPFASSARASALCAALAGFATLTARYGDAKGAGDFG